MTFVPAARVTLCQVIERPLWSPRSALEVPMSSMRGPKEGKKSMYSHDGVARVVYRNDSQVVRGRCLTPRYMGRRALVEVNLARLFEKTIIMRSYLGEGNSVDGEFSKSTLDGNSGKERGRKECREHF